MKRLNLKLAAALVAAAGAVGAVATPAMAAEEQFVPLLVYRTCLLYTSPSPRD